MKKSERAVLKAIREVVRYFKEDDDWPDDTELMIMRADPDDADFTLGDLRGYVELNKGKR